MQSYAHRHAHPWTLVAPSVFLMAWGGNHFTPLLNVYETRAHYQPWQANFLLGAYVLGLIPGLLIAAAMSDQHGRKTVLIRGIGAAALGSALLGFGEHSFEVLCLGRALAGVGVGVAMSVGTSWMKELSSPPFESGAPLGAGARRPSLTLTLGFGLGAGVTGLLAQWAPLPMQLPYGIHFVLTLVALVWLLKAPESLPVEKRNLDHWWHDLAVPTASSARFTGYVVPAAPWVFGAAGVAYAIIPTLEAPELGRYATLFATLLTVITLGAGAVIQQFAAAIDRSTGGRALPVGLSLMTVGMALAVVTAMTRNVFIASGTAILLGCAYGLTVSAGLAQVQGIATSKDLAGLTGVYYSLAYTGFLLPTVLAALLPLASYPAMLTVVAVICAGCLGKVAWWRHVQLRAPRVA